MREMIILEMHAHHSGRKAAKIIASEAPRSLSLKFILGMELSIVTGRLASPKVILDNDLHNEEQHVLHVNMQCLLQAALT